MAVTARARLSLASGHCGKSLWAIEYKSSRIASIMPLVDKACPARESTSWMSNFAVDLKNPDQKRSAAPALVSRRSR
eukprot:9498362-Pyramimonas_sp.AAC.1